MDSGAGKSVMNPDAVPEYMLQESQGQIQGQHFLGAGGERLPNIGQKCVPLMTADGVSRLATFQITPVRKPLLAVSASCDAGHMCVFDNDGSYIIERESPEGREIRRLAKQCVAKMTLERKNGVYTHFLLEWYPQNDSPRTLATAPSLSPAIDPHLQMIWRSTRVLPGLVADLSGGHRRGGVGAPHATYKPEARDRCRSLSQHSRD